MGGGDSFTHAPHFEFATQNTNSSSNSPVSMTASSISRRTWSQRSTRVEAQALGVSGAVQANHGAGDGSHWRRVSPTQGGTRPLLYRKRNDMRQYR